MMTSHKGSARPLTMGIMLIRRRIHLQHSQYSTCTCIRTITHVPITVYYELTICPLKVTLYHTLVNSTILRRSLLFFILSSAYGFYFKKCTSFLQNLIVLLFWYLAISEASVVKKINFVAFEIVDLDTNSCFNKILRSNQQFVKLSWKKILSFIPLSDCPQNGTYYSY